MVFASSVINRSKPGISASCSASRRIAAQYVDVGGAWTRAVNSASERSSRVQKSESGVGGMAIQGDQVAEESGARGAICWEEQRRMWSVWRAKWGSGRR